MNKKGDFIDFLGDFFTIFIIAMLLAVMFFVASLSSVNKSKEEIKTIQQSFEQPTLINLLETRHKLDINSDNVMEDINLADLIVYYYNIKDYDQIKNTVKQDISPLFKETRCIWSINVYYDKKSMFSFGEFTNNNLVLEDINVPNIRLSNVTLPINKTDSITVYYADNLLDKEEGKC